MQLTRRSACQGLALALSSPWTARAPAAQGDGDARIPELDSLALEILGRTGVPGLSVAVVHRDQIIYVRGFGVRQVGRPEPVDPDTIFQLASVSKPIASTVVAALAGDGLLDWDDPIARHDPAFAMQDAWVTRQVTLRDMFSHRSGLPDHAGDALEDMGYDRAEILRRLRHVKPGSDFRSRYAYTNFGLTAAAVAAAKASGTSWEDISAERLYRPLGMTSTSSRFANFLASTNRAMGHVRQDGAWAARHTRNPDAQSPAGGVCSSARDMASWLRLQLGRGSVDGRKIIDSAPLDETHRPHIASTPAADPARDRTGYYGLGWNVGQEEQGFALWGHSGAFRLGAATCVEVLPAEQIGIVALTNSSPVGVPEAVCRSFLDILLTGKRSKDWLALFAPLFEKIMAPEYGTAIDYSRPPAGSSPALPAPAYHGSYDNMLFGRIQVAATDAGLVLRLGPQQVPFALRHFDRDVFTYQPTGENAYGPSAVTFAVRADRKAASVTLENLDLNGQGRFERANG